MALDALLLPVALLSIAASSALYTWIWFAPHTFRRLVSPHDPCAVMATAAHVLKAVQFGSILALTDFNAAAALPWWTWLACLTLIALGQHLNGLVYARLGRDGVYYGARFGKAVPWVSAYPYNAMRDPQYIGCILTLLGCAPFAPRAAVAWWLMNYVYLMWLESSVPEPLAGVM